MSNRADRVQAIAFGVFISGMVLVVCTLIGFTGWIEVHREKARARCLRLGYRLTESDWKGNGYCLVFDGAAHRPVPVEQLEAEARQ